MTKEERVDFSKYGKDFQETLCQLVLIDRPFADQIFEVLDINFLELKFLQIFVKLIQNYRIKFSTHPSENIMKSILRTELSSEIEATQMQVRDYFARIYKTDPLDQEYVKNTALDFCRKQNLKGAMLQSVDLLQSCSFDEISKIINDSLKLGSETNFGHDYLADFEERYLPKHRRPVTTGWSDIDLISGGD